MSLKKSILILVMTDNSDFSKKEKAVIESTWAKPVIQGKYHNIMYYSYTAMDECMKCNTPHKNLGAIDNVCSTVFVPTDDDEYSTYKKTYVALRTLEPVISRYKFDYIFKTDLATYVNVPLLDEFVQTYINDYEETIYTGKIKSAKYSIGPRSFCLFPDRSSMLIPVKPYYNVLTELKYRANAIKNDKVVKCPDEYDAVRKNVDENAMGFIIDNYLIALGRDHYEYYRDWNIRTFDDIEECDWHKQIVMNIRHCKCHVCEFDDHRYVHDVVNDYYLDGNKPDLTYMLNYMYSSKCPKIHVVDESVNKDEPKQVSLTEYKKIFSSGSISSITSSTVVKPGSSTGSTGWPGATESLGFDPYHTGGADQCYHYSYLDFMDVPHHHIDNCPNHDLHESDGSWNTGNNGNTGNSNTGNNNGGNNSNDFGGDSGSDDKVKNPNMHPCGDRHNNWHYKYHKDCSCNMDDSDNEVSEDPSCGGHHHCHKYHHNHKHCHCDCHCDCSCGGNIIDPSVPEIPNTSVVEPEEPVNPSTGTNHCPTDCVDKDGHHNTSCPCDDDDIWCNCVCDGHQWYHDISASENPSIVSILDEPEMESVAMVSEISLMMDSTPVEETNPVEETQQTEGGKLKNILARINSLKN